MLRQKKIWISLIVMILTAFYIIRVWNINVHAFRPEKKVYDVGEVCRFGDFEHKLLSCEVKSPEEVEAQFGVKPVNRYEFDLDYIVTKLEVRYCGEEAASFYFEGKYFISESWYNGRDIQLEMQINGTNQTFEQGEKRELWFIGVLPKGQFTEAEWKNRHQMKFEIIFQTLPKEVRMKCN